MKNRFIALIILFVLSLPLFAQSDAGSEIKLGFYIPYEDPPMPINQQRPVYPERCKAENIEGTVVLEVEIFNDGSIGKINVLKSMKPQAPELDEAAIECVRKWKFQPGRYAGKPVDTTVIIPIQFTITNDGKGDNRVKVSIKSKPKDAVISIDGKFKGKTNHHLHLFKDKTYKLTISKPGYESIEQDITVNKGGKNDYIFHLTKKLPE